MQNTSSPLLWDIQTAHKALKQKIISSKELTSIFLKQAKSVQKDYNAYITICEDHAMSAAKKADEMISKGNINILCGIPYAAKDNICTKGILTTCASKALENFIPPQNAFVIDLLDDCGAVLLGKTNMDEFAMGSDGQSSVFGAAKNPVNALYCAGGSSSGSACAVASHSAMFALGSDTGGSVRQPAAFCGVCGMSPTYGAISRNGLVSFCSSMDRIGVITKNAYDNAVVLNELCKHDPNDPTCISSNTQNFTDGITHNACKLKIGVAPELFDGDIQPQVKKACLDAINKLGCMGFEIIEISFPSFEICSAAYTAISYCEAFSNLSRYDGIRYGSAQESFDNIDKLYTQYRSRSFGNQVKKRIMLGALCLNTSYYQKALQAKRIIKQDIFKCFEKCDVIACPTSPATAYKLNSSNDSVFSDMLTVCASLADICAVSINCGHDSNNLPIGLQFMAKPFCESQLYKLAHAYEVQNDK